MSTTAVGPNAGLPTYVLVHGASSNAAGWGPLQRELALLGHRSLALDLPGHGTGSPASYYQNPHDAASIAVERSPMAEVTYEETVEHVIANVRRVAEHGPVILVGSSMGGATIGGVGNAVPELIHRIVYVSAWCPSSVPSLAECSALPEHASNLLDTAPIPAVGDPERIGTMRINWRTDDAVVFAALKAAMAADATDEQFRAMLDTLDPDETMSIALAESQVRAETWGRIPRSYVRLSEDMSIPVAMQDRMIADADALTPDNPFDVHTMKTSHVGFFHRAPELAGILAAMA
ncbi:alpha/beta fold hydrolase [Actinoalloteichus hymeniacidonis]|uniref:Hydrolase or acyltransferase of alpha/beta superfamily n=1 Tax=Actinoalloteichus hymeniacidonis TaxID=340345 RepID=A0AAC9MZF8_9PSEU|nr:alpha/beta hydrolase [Actinoalloteichus hymeniacidonis]AOS64424.1 putative hydrolase or acyltransferase of alpha/beta superfamily [Actinoalloteichus hymeniacidonis]MBB5907508.1 pimeloyl-ACP methyl ester carboxylesterase [Actinoalloteichus hymeniacidonis]